MTYITETSFQKKHYRQRLQFKLILLTWIVIIISLAVFAAAIIPAQRDALIKSMEVQAKTLSSSIAEVTLTSIAVDDYATVVDHCSKILEERNSISYLVVTQRDGSSNIFTKDHWQFNKLGGIWVPEEQSVEEGMFLNSDLVDTQVFHYSHPLRYATVSIGWIHIGLSLDTFKKDNRAIYLRTIFIAFFTMLIGLIPAIWFSKRLTRPIQLLNEVTHEITSGDLTAHVNIKSGDELEELASSFNAMTDNLHKSRDELKKAHDELERRVHDRTLELMDKNVKLEREIVERKKAEEIIKSSLQEKEVLLKEVHHRVKNNLQVISSMLFLQSKTMTNPETIEKFRDSQSRVKSMALIHEKIYQSKDLSHVDFAEYIRNLSSYLINSYIHDDMQVRLELDIENIMLDLNSAIPCGLILNEMISNSLKYAFPKNEEGFHEDRKIKVCMSQPAVDKVRLEIADNGIGLPETFDLENAESLGLRLVHSLIRQLDGELSFSSNGGTKFSFSFPVKSS